MTGRDAAIGGLAETERGGRSWRALPVVRGLRRLLRNPQGLIGLVILVLLVLGAVFAPLIARSDPNAQNAARFLAPSWAHPFGTDELRRDLFSRTLYGLRTELEIILAAVGTGAVAGTAIGFIAGYAGGWTEICVMRVVDAMLAFPGLLAALAIITILGSGARNIGIAIAIFNVPGFIRLARAAMLAERYRDYVQAAQATGAGPLRVVFRHIAPNALPSLVVHLALASSAAVLLEAGLSFLGLGVRPPLPSLGGLINASKTYLKLAWWYAFFPGAVLAGMVLSFNFLADAINEASSPYARR